MDMKKILQAMDGANTKAEVNSSDMKRFLSVVNEANLNQPAASQGALPAAPKFSITQTTYDSLGEPPDFTVTNIERGVEVASFESEEEARAYVAQQDPAGAPQTELHQMQSKATAPEANPDAAPQQPVAEEVGMSRLLSIISEGKGPLNRPTAAESMAMQHYAEPAKKTITAPVLNVAEGAKPSMIGKYFKTVEQELREAAERPNERATRLAKRVIERIVPNADGSLPDPSINRLTGKPNPPAAEPAPAAAPGGSTVEYGGETYSVNVFGDGIRPRIGPSNKSIGAKAYILGNKMYVLLDPSTQEDLSEDSDPCWKDYKQIGMKKKGGKTVPNCVPKEAVNPAQQAAIAIAKKKAGKK